ncbi:MAG TPA: T9SS type A sorting domain-containing protein, partial [Candidatus Kapabacteria bacterium]|nr:T9SS type A sorting domain-containing protein [Candidatus Kapabacteria bacterium]
SDMNYVGCMSPLDRDIVFAGGFGNDRHILVSIDHGMSWNVDTFAYSSDTDYPEINALAVTSDNHGVAIADIPGSASSTVLMLGEPVSMDVMTSRLINSNLQIYPNPASQAISLESQEAGKPVEILDVLGQEVLSGRVPASGRLTLDISSLPAGLYYVSDGHSRTKFVKE